MTGADRRMEARIHDREARKGRADREAKSREDWWRIFEEPAQGHSSARAAGEGAEETAPELFLRAPAPPASVQRTEEPTKPRDDCSSLHRGRA